MLRLKSIILFFPLLLVLYYLFPVFLGVKDFLEFHFDLSIMFMNMYTFIDLSLFALGILLYICNIITYNIIVGTYTTLL